MLQLSMARVASDLLLAFASLFLPSFFLPVCCFSLKAVADLTLNLGLLAITDRAILPPLSWLMHFPVSDTKF